jgi:alcohol dehydrogenase
MFLEAMQAAVYRQFGGPIRLEQVPVPSIAPDDILVQVMATGVCRSDWHGWKGHDDDIKNHGLPFVPGHELSGVVVQVGRLVKLFFVGDRVMAPFILSCGNCQYCHRDRPTVCSNQQQPGFTYWGSFAEYVAISRADRNVKRIPDNVSFVQAASLGCRFTTAYRAVKQQGKLKDGESIAVFGAGGVGLSCIMIAASLGAAIIVAVDLSKDALELAVKLGATHVVDASAKDCCEQVQSLCGGEGADLCIDAAGFAAISVSSHAL